MIPMISTVVGLLLAGFIFGRVRTTGPRGRVVRMESGRGNAVILAAIIALPVLTLMLAKLFNSNLLGWIFGLTLMAGVALLPCAAIVYVGLRLGTRGARKRASNPQGAASLLVHAARSGVHASDDAPSLQISVPIDTTMRALTTLVLANIGMPTIAGGKASWLIESTGAGGSASSDVALRPIAVYAQQWTEVKFLIPADVSVAAHFGQIPLRLYLRYLCQDDPDTVLATFVPLSRQ